MDFSDFSFCPQKLQFLPMTHIALNLADSDTSPKQSCDLIPNTNYNASQLQNYIPTDINLSNLPWVVAQPPASLDQR